MDLIALRDSPSWNEDGPVIVQQLNQIKNTFRSPENGGDTIEGFKIPDDVSTIVTEQNVLVVKRTWNTQQIAQQYADAVSNITTHTSVTVEEQI